MYEIELHLILDSNENNSRKLKCLMMINNINAKLSQWAA